jgi:hypothetical protein
VIRVRPVPIAQETAVKQLLSPRGKTPTTGVFAHRPSRHRDRRKPRVCAGSGHERHRMVSDRRADIRYHPCDLRETWRDLNAVSAPKTSDLMGAKHRSETRD